MTHTPKIVLVDAHAPWEPHRSGRKWPADAPFDEHGVSHAVHDLAALALNTGRSVPLVQVLAMDERFRGYYSEGLRDLTARCEDADLVVSCHVDVAAAHFDGPFALTGAGMVARRWAQAALAQLEAMSGIRRRGRRAGGVFDVTSERYRGAFGSKWLVDHGPKNVVLFELGNVRSPSDRAWLESCGTRQAAAAIARATREIYAIY